LVLAQACGAHGFAWLRTSDTGTATAWSGGCCSLQRRSRRRGVVNGF
jgi:hypothetical protein